MVRRQGGPPVDRECASVQVGFGVYLHLVYLLCGRLHHPGDQPDVQAPGRSIQGLPSDLGDLLRVLSGHSLQFRSIPCLEQLQD